jgi:hypothetical protein
MASPSTSASCHHPSPIWEISRSPTPIPTLTPTTSSTTRRNRCCPNPTPIQITTAMGAKKGRLCPNNSAATSHASEAATEHWRIGNAISRNACPRRRTVARTRTQLTRTTSR